MKGKKINDGKKIGGMTGQSAASDFILENVAYGAAYGTLWSVAGKVFLARGPTLI